VVIEESLKPVMNHLQVFKDKSTNIQGIFVLTDQNKTNITQEQVVYILRPNIDDLEMAMKQRTL